MSGCKPKEIAWVAPVGLKHFAEYPWLPRPAALIASCNTLEIAFDDKGRKGFVNVKKNGF